VILKYFRIFVLREILPLYGENYDLCWSQTCYEGKTVLDLGADYGSTVYYFLKRGAKRVIAVEGDRTLALQLEKNFWRDERVVCLHKWIGDTSDFEFVILVGNTYGCDLAKVDVEGAEKHLVGVQPEALQSIGEWLIEAHTKQVCEELSKVFLNLGFKVFASRYDIAGVYRILRCTNKQK